jgi:hypothetical protein
MTSQDNSPEILRNVLADTSGYAVARLVEALRYKPEGRVAGSITDGVTGIFQ